MRATTCASITYLLPIACCARQGACRLTYHLDSRYFSANYAIVVALLGVYSLLTNPLLLVALGFLIGGFLAISRFGMSRSGRVRVTHRWDSPG